LEFADNEGEKWDGMSGVGDREAEGRGQGVVGEVEDETVLEDRGSLRKRGKVQETTAPNVVVVSPTLEGSIKRRDRSWCRGGSRRAKNLAHTEKLHLGITEITRKGPWYVREGGRGEFHWPVCIMEEIGGLKSDTRMQVKPP